MIRWIVMALLVLGLIPVGAAPCLADGKVFRTGIGKVEIPDQDAMIVWRDGVETLAIETRFIGAGQDFAWVVPLPSKPEISPGTSGLFPTLRALCAPKVVRRVDAFWVVCIWTTLFLLLAMVASVKRMRHIAIFLGFFVPLSCFVLLPSLGTPRGGGGPGPAVEVLERRVIGSYDVSTVASADPDALGAWLKDNGFTMSPAAQPVIADYVKAGWVFSAAKLRRDKDTLEPSAPHPLVFKFKSHDPVYPLRLTAVENGPLKVDLYVFGPERAAAAGFKVSRCAAAEIRDADEFRYSPQIDYRIDVSHSGLADLAGRGMTLTKLSATLSPQQMAEDAVVRFSSGNAYLPVFLTPDAAVHWSMNLGSGVLVTGVLIAFVTTRKATGNRRREFKRVLVALAAGLMTGGIAYGSLSKLPAASDGRGANRRFHEMRYLGVHLWSEVHERKASGQMPTESWLREQIPRVWKDLAGSEVPVPNEGDSPGCFWFKLTPNHELEFTWYDEFGQMHRSDSK